MTGAKDLTETYIPRFQVGDAPRMKLKPMAIGVSKDVCSVAFLADGKHLVGGGYGGKLRVWQMGDGQEVGTAMDAGNTTVLDIAVSWDGKWVVAGTGNQAGNGQVIVWNAKHHEKVTEFQGHKNWVRAVDVSPDVMKIASGSDDKTVCVWSLSSGERLLGPLEHDYVLAAVKFSQNGDLLATATWWKESVRIYNTRDGCFLFDLPIRVISYENRSLAWSFNSMLLSVLSFDGDIKCCDVTTGAMYSKWPVHTGSDPGKCMVVASNEKFVAISANSMVSFWDTTTHKEIGSVIEHTDAIRSIAISPNYDLAIGGGKTITIRSLEDILPLHYIDDVSAPHCGTRFHDNFRRRMFRLTMVSIVSMSLQTRGSQSLTRHQIFITSEWFSHDSYFVNSCNSFHSRCFPNDLTRHVRRDSHDPVASGGFADIYSGMLQMSREPIRVCDLLW